MKRIQPFVGLTLPLCLSCLLVQAVAEERQLEAYECEQDGVPSFSDSPCGPDGQRLGLDYEQPSAASVDSARRAVDETEAQTDRYLRQIELQREIARSEGRISDLRKERDAKLRQLRASLNNAEGRTTQSIWDTGVREQMAEVAARYASDIEAEQIRLERLLQREVELGRP
ncbi:hypothetical protein [Halochromatium sp.]